MNFFKKIFSREPEQLSLNHIELQDWIEENSEKILSEEIEAIKEYFSKFREIKIELKEKLDNLQKADLLNPNIPEREKHIMEGNRTTYLTKMYTFLENMKEPKLDYKEINFLEKFCDDFNKNLEELNKETAKGYFVLTNFFDKEVKGIAISIKKLEEPIIHVKEFMSEGKLSEYKELVLKIRELNEKKVNTEKIGTDITILDQEIKENKEKKDLLERRLNLLKTGEEYHTFNKMGKEKEEIDAELTKLNSKLNNTIKPLDKHLKKLAHESLKNEIILEYLNNPLLALEKDENIKILNIIDQIRLSLENADEKDKQTEKLLKHIDTITREYFENIKKENERLKQEKETISGILSRATIVMDIKEVEYQLEHITEKVNEQEKLLGNKKEMQQEIVNQTKEKKLEKLLSDFSEKKITILD